MTYLYPNQVLFLAREALSVTGDALILRDKGLFESAVYRPQAGFAGREFYPDLFSKAAALGFSIIRNHPFLDGNKRIGYAAMDLMLELNGHRIGAADAAKIKFALDIARGGLDEKAIAAWLKRNSRKIQAS